ncbi:glucoside xylosyltransferase 1 isoform X8 [Chelonia mydas]|uniref:glucoside xylosyltransferase 1 isoform X8 n=1 Tax=Chelonia mydas TaxID=8469 RepID=UPI001CA9B297|nr:glucoside xylosyltransferase 1 isoform X8 [Chelonia mydas]
MGEERGRLQRGGGVGLLTEPPSKRNWSLQTQTVLENSVPRGSTSEAPSFSSTRSSRLLVLQKTSARHTLVPKPTKLNGLPYQGKFNYTVYPITFPTESAAEWKKLFKPCASQRLFLPLILKDVDSLLYVDTDILFLRPVDDIWSFLKKFNSTQIAAMAPEHEEPRIGWYNRFARHPYYGITGINSGVMLMNMTRIRRKYFKNDMTTARLQWGEILMPLLKKYKLNITWGDQDLLNIMFFHNPESLFVFPCQWNYRPDHCIYGSNCKEAEEKGIFILHGNRGVYHDDKQPTFRAIYEAIKKYSFGDDLVNFLLQPLELELQKTMHTYCGRIYKVFIKQLTKSIRDIYDRRSKGS